MPRYPDTETVNGFRADGVTVLRGVFNDWINTLRRGVAANMADPHPDRRLYRDEAGGGSFFVDYCNWQRIPEYRDFIFNSPAAEIGAGLMGSRTVRLFHEHILVKEAGANIPTPWHHDQPYYCVECPQTVSLWIPLDAVPRERTPEFIAGSHRSGKLYRPLRFNGEALNENDGLEDMPDIDADRGAYDIRGWALLPGDAVAFDYRTIHGAPGNTSRTARRRAFSLRLVGDNATFVRRDRQETSPPFPDVTLRHGDPLDGEAFPLVYQG